MIEYSFHFVQSYFIWIGKIQFNKYRDFESDRRVESHKNIIDGDLIETFLELSNSEASSLIKDFKVSFNFSRKYNNSK